jgi:hypothetical protein
VASNETVKLCEAYCVRSVLRSVLLSRVEGGKPPVARPKSGRARPPKKSGQSRVWRLIDGSLASRRSPIPSRVNAGGTPGSRKPGGCTGRA